METETAEVMPDDPVKALWNDAKTMSHRELLEAVYVNTSIVVDFIRVLDGKLGDALSSLEDNPMIQMLMGGKKKR